MIRVFKNDARIQTADATRHALWFSISSLANGLWIFAWHSRAIGLSVLLMLVVLGSLILASLSTRSADLLTRTAFGVYLGWITVATIANLTTWFVDLGVEGLASSSVVVTIVILLIGGFIASVYTWFQKDIAYGAVVVWAYLGILIKHLDSQAFQGAYVGIIVTVILVMLGLLAVNGLTIVKRKKV
ncbi:MAG: tryptophan-rich sensory protein [Bacillus subtilis]|nr:tryptophan-rich sensory protein [Bacillus subtilis]